MDYSHLLAIGGGGLHKLADAGATVLQHAKHMLDGESEVQHAAALAARTLALEKLEDRSEQDAWEIIAPAYHNFLIRVRMPVHPTPAPKLMIRVP